MAEAFLSQLLTVQNSVRPHSSERCIICLTECSTLCPETGIVEWEMRLPCNHTVGSRCIATWLDPRGAANNSCPVCRRGFFFPAQPRPYLEHGIMDGGHVNRAGSGESADSEAPGFGPRSPFYSGTGNANETTYGGITGPEESMTGSFDHYALVDDLAITKILCEIYCYKLDLSPSATAIDIARVLGENLHAACQPHNRRSSFIAAVSVLVASFLTDVPRTVHSVSVVFDVAAAEVLSLYRSRVRAALDDERLLAVIGRGVLEVVLGLLPDAPA